MLKAIWNNVVIAESETYESVEGNVYFPPESVKKAYLKPSDTTSVCPWKGTASYYTVIVNGEENLDAAWCYADPKSEAANIKDHIAFWNGVAIED